MNGQELYAEYQSHLEYFKVWTAPWSNVQVHIQEAWNNLAASIDRRAETTIVTQLRSETTDPRD